MFRTLTASVLAGLGMIGAAAAFENTPPATPAPNPEPVPLVAPEQPPAPAPVPVPEPAPQLAPAVNPKPQIHTWPGGFVYTNGPEVIVRQNSTTGNSTNIISGSSNGFGNRIVVDNGRGNNGTTIIQNSRNGIGNRIVVDDWLLELPPLGIYDFRPLPPVVRTPVPVAPVIPHATDLPPVPAPAPKCYRGKDNTFWTKKVWSDSFDCNLYWSPRDERWYRYSRDDDSYRPIPTE